MIPVFIEPTRTVAVKVDINKTVRPIGSTVWVLSDVGLEEGGSNERSPSMIAGACTDCSLDSMLEATSTMGFADMTAS